APRPPPWARRCSPPRRPAARARDGRTAGRRQRPGERRASRGRRRAIRRCTATTRAAGPDRVRRGAARPPRHRPRGRARRARGCRRGRQGWTPCPQRPAAPAGPAPARAARWAPPLHSLLSWLRKTRSETTDPLVRRAAPSLDLVVKRRVGCQLASAYSDEPLRHLEQRLQALERARGVEAVLDSLVVGVAKCENLAAPDRAVVTHDGSPPQPADGDEDRDGAVLEE